MMNSTMLLAKIGQLNEKIQTVDGGESAYEIAQKNGYEGTEEEWLESLKAETFPPGSLPTERLEDCNKAKEGVNVTIPGPKNGPEAALYNQISIISHFDAGETKAQLAIIFSSKYGIDVGKLWKRVYTDGIWKKWERLIGNIDTIETAFKKVFMGHQKKTFGLFDANEECSKPLIAGVSTEKRKNLPVEEEGIFISAGDHYRKCRFLQIYCPSGENEGKVFYRFVDFVGTSEVFDDWKQFGGKGEPGRDGVPGMNGINGNGWMDGIGEPTGDLGNPGDYYLDTSNGDIYRKRDYEYWEEIGNLKGPAGDGAGGASSSIMTLSQERYSEQEFKGGESWSPVKYWNEYPNQVVYQYDILPLSNFEIYSTGALKTFLSKVYDDPGIDTSTPLRVLYRTEVVGSPEEKDSPIANAAIITQTITVVGLEDVFFSGPARNRVAKFERQSMAPLKIALGDGPESPGGLMWEDWKLALFGDYNLSVDPIHIGVDEYDSEKMSELEDRIKALESALAAK